MGEGALGQEAGTAGKAGAAGERKGHSRSRSWVAAVTAPFARSASGALKPSEEVCSSPQSPLSADEVGVLATSFHDQPGMRAYKKWAAGREWEG